MGNDYSFTWLEVPDMDIMYIDDSLYLFKFLFQFFEVYIAWSAFHHQIVSIFDDRDGGGQG